MDIVNKDVYILRSRHRIWGKLYYNYINFNVNSKNKNPIVVTDIAHTPINQVYFESKDEAIKFMFSFIKGNSNRSNKIFTVEKYKGKYSKTNSQLVEVYTKYGKCLKIVNVKK